MKNRLKLWEELCCDYLAAQLLSVSVLTYLLDALSYETAANATACSENQ